MVQQNFMPSWSFPAKTFDIALFTATQLDNGTFFSKAQKRQMEEVVLLSLHLGQNYFHCLLNSQNDVHEFF